jgi:hypothetical protein
MEVPTFTDYVTLIFNLFERFVQERGSESDWYSGRYTYKHKTLIVFFVMMQYRRIFKFKAQWRWLKAHPTEREQLGFESVPDRTTLSRRYKALYPILQAFIAFVGQYAEQLDGRFAGRDLFEDKSLFKAQGPVWHQSDRRAGRIPEKLRGLDTDATWSKSGYHGWVYGYSVHLTCNPAAFPKLAQVETGAYSEKQALDTKELFLLDHLQPATLTGDDGYTKALRIRQWAKHGVALLTPALRWVKGRYAEAYHRYIAQPENVSLLHDRQTAIEPFFDLLAQVVGATDNHKQLSIQCLANVRTCLALGILIIQIAMIANSIWDLPLRSISHIGVAFT